MCAIDTLERPRVVLMDMPSSILHAIRLSDMRYDADIRPLASTDDAIAAIRERRLAAALLRWPNGSTNLAAALRSHHPDATIIAVCDDCTIVADPQRRCPDATFCVAPPIDCRVLVNAVRVSVARCRNRRPA